MSAFMDNYEGNKDRTDRWIATFPEGRLNAQIVEFDAVKGYVLVQAKGWRNQLELEPAGVDYAYGYAAAYSDKMRRWMVEDTCTSALMRVMALIMGGTEKSTKETMQHVQSFAEPPIDDDPWSKPFGEDGFTTAADGIGEIAGQLGSQLVAAAPRCVHGSRIWREGVSAKTGNAWANYSCAEKVKTNQCNPVWYVLASDGQWKPQV